MLAYLKVPSLSPLPGKSKRRLLRPFCASASAIFDSTKPFLWSPNPWHRMAMSCARHSQTGLLEAQGRCLAVHMCRHSCLCSACSSTFPSSCWWHASHKCNFTDIECERYIKQEARRLPQIQCPPECQSSAPPWHSLWQCASLPLRLSCFGLLKLLLLLLFCES